MTIHICLFNIQLACTNGDIRLRDGPSSTEGRPELCKGGVYYQICDDRWSQNDARVICNMLGYSIYGKTLIITMITFFVNVV